MLNLFFFVPLKIKFSLSGDLICFSFGSNHGWVLLKLFEFCIIEYKKKSCLSSLSLLKFWFLELSGWIEIMMEAGSSNSSGQLSGRVVDTRGKHRIHAELKRLEQEARFLEVCIHLISSFKNGSLFACVIIKLELVILVWIFIVFGSIFSGVR